MYTGSAAYYDLVYDFIDYEGDAGRIRALLDEEAPRARTLLDVGCGTGQHLEHLRPQFLVEGLDANGDLLAVAAQRLPGVRLHEARMEDFDLGRQFDVITCLFSAIAYTRTVAAMRQTIATLVRHLEPGGVLLIEPWFRPDAFWSDTITSNHASRDGIEVSWMYVSRRQDDLSILDMHYLIGTPSEIRHVTEQHQLGLFTERQHLDALRDHGLRATFDRSGPFGRGRGLYVARRAAEGRKSDRE